MNIEFTRICDVAVYEREDKDSQLRFRQIGDRVSFQFNGKTKSRRAIRVMIKALMKATDCK